MTISAATLRKLINAGLSGEALIDIVESIENDMKPVRSSGAERQARYRERKRNERDVTSDVTGDVTGDASLPLDKESFPQTPFKETNPPKENPPKGGQKKRGHRLPEDWRPSDEDWLLAVGELGEQGAERQLLTFRDHWAAQPGQKGVKLDWGATWRNWIRNSRNFAPRSASPPHLATPAGFR